MTAYEPATIEKKWQKHWAAKKIYHTADSVRGKKNRMVLVEFPYPSGDLHMGHWYAFALPDMHARFVRMRGDNVMYPIGFDAFGLPAENAAIKRGIHPEEWTKQNIATMTTQMESMGTMFDFSRQVSTIDPDYYRWTQWLFIQMFNKGLAYRAKTKVNWCPTDKTVLANEQVVDGCCERCGTIVIQKELEQWMMKITDYADRLLDDMQALDWPNATKKAQENWIGRSEGVRVTFPVVNESPVSGIEVFTTRVDTIFSGTFIVISPELAQKWMNAGWAAPDAARKYIERSLGRRELERLEAGGEKTGVFTDIYAINPASKEEIPVWIADFVLGHYGTGAVFADAHDERDFEFAKKFNIPLKTSIHPAVGGDAEIRSLQKCFTEEGILHNSGKFDGMTSAQARREITQELGKEGLAKAERQYRLRDWVLSRQRYWGVPIPMIYCKVCGWQPVADDDLPVKLPKLTDYLPTDDGKSPLAKVEDFVNATCPNCGDPAQRETDTMDTFVDSSWYFLRYTDPENSKKFADAKKIKEWLPVSIYIGGAEHNTMHLLYSRFFTKVLFDLGYISFDEPFLARRNHGIILGPDGQKMSKSKENVVNPDSEVAKYGTDTVRMFLAFMAPYEQGAPWDPKGITGVHRFLKRTWALFGDTPLPAKSPEQPQEVFRAVHGAIKRIGEDVQALHFNTCVSELMKLLNVLEDNREVLCVDHCTIFAILLAPFAPHLAEELWMGVLGKKVSVHLESWPEYDPTMLIEAIVKIPVQVNGKVRGFIMLAPDVVESDAVFAAKQDEGVARHLGDGVVQKVIYLPGKLLNIVVASTHG